MWEAERTRGVNTIANWKVPASRLPFLMCKQKIDILTFQPLLAEVGEHLKGVGGYAVLQLHSQPG